MVTCLTLVEQELLTVPEHMSSSLVFSGDRVTRSLVVCFVDRYLSFCTFSFHYCVVCSSSTYGFWLSLWYLQGLLRSKHIWLFNVLQRTQMQSLFLFNTRFKFQNITIIFNYHSKVAVSRECNKRWRLHQNCCHYQNEFRKLIDDKWRMSYVDCIMSSGGNHVNFSEWLDLRTICEQLYLKLDCFITVSVSAM